MNNARFSDYVTSGAFTLTLTRNQVSSLAMVAANGSSWIDRATALEHKGLVETVPNPDEYQPDRVEYRATLAGLLCASMLAEAGLTNGPADPLGDELAALRCEIIEQRQKGCEARLAARSAIARKEEAEIELLNAKAQIAELKDGLKRKLHILVRTRDPMPEVTDWALGEIVREPVG